MGDGQVLYMYEHQCLPEVSTLPYEVIELWEPQPDLPTTGLFG